MTFLLPLSAVLNIQQFTCNCVSDVHHIYTQGDSREHDESKSRRHCYNHDNLLLKLIDLILAKAILMFS